MIELLFVSLACVYISGALGVAAFLYLWVARKHTTEVEKEAFRKAHGLRGKIEACVAFVSLAIALSGTAYFGRHYIALVSLPLFGVAFSSNLFDVLHMIRSKQEWSKMARRSVLIPGTLVMMAVVLWTYACISYAVVRPLVKAEDFVGRSNNSQPAAASRLRE